MKQFKLTYEVNLKPSKGGFCTTPFEIMQQMDAAQRNARRNLRDFLAREGLGDQVKSVAAVSNGIGLMLICTDEVAQRLKGEAFVSSIEEDRTPHLPPKFRL
jgi:hypothetical protein